MDATGSYIPGRGQDTPSPTFPCFQQSMRKQWQGTGLAAQVVQNDIHQPFLHFPVPEGSRLKDGAREFLAVHRANEFLILGDELPEAILLRQLSVEIRA